MQRSATGMAFMAAMVVASIGCDRTGLSQAASAVDDAWITTKIQSQYFLDRDIKGRQIDVDTRAGVVTLKGSVDTAAQKQAAEQIAQDTDGVSRVVNQLNLVATR